MGLFDALKSFVNSVNHEYDRRIRAASLVKEYDPTGASHHGAHVITANEHVEAVIDTDGADGSHGTVVVAPPTQQQQSAPRQVTH